MPRYPARVLPAGYQVSRRPGGWYLQRQDEESGAWADVAGPYKRRGGAIDWWLRMRGRQALESETETEGES